MPGTNGQGPKRAILYARVSTDEQARSGYSLAQQSEALREYATREGYEVLEEVSDPCQSGASLERPGMDHVTWWPLAASLWCLHKTESGSQGNLRITTCSGGSSRSTGRRYERSTTGETRVRRGSSLTVSWISSPSSSGRKQPNAADGESCARSGKERSWLGRRPPTASRSPWRETATRWIKRPCRS
jgi:hypothetical protein